MKKGKYLLILVITSTFLCFGQEETDYIEYHEGTKVIWRKGKVLNGKPHKTWEYYNEAGELSRTGNWNEGVLDGIWKTYISNGKLWEVETYKNDLKNGTYIKMDLYSNLALFKGQYSDDNPTGIWTSYITEGEKAGQVYSEIEFAPLGEISPATIYCYNAYSESEDDPNFFCPYKRQGTIKFMSSEEVSYENGMSNIQYLYIHLDINALFHGEWTSFYENGQVFSKGDYIDGFKQNSWNYYYPNGKLWMKCQFSGGVKVWSVESESNGTVTYERNYMNGPYELYYKNGSLKEKGEFNFKEEKIGIWKYYNEDGSLEKTETYIDGVKQ